MSFVRYNTESNGDIFINTTDALNISYVYIMPNTLNKKYIGFLK